MNALLFCKLKVFRGVVRALLFSIMMISISISSGWSTPAPDSNSTKLSAQEKEDLVQQGVDQYHQGAHDQAQKKFELAESVFPENYATPYYLGLIYLEKGRRAAAIKQWQRYVSMDPMSENATRIRKNLTLLLREEARESAKAAVAHEASLIRKPTEDHTVAVSTFKNLGSENIQPLGKGMAALLIHDLSLIPDLKVVERVKLQALLGEMKLGTSGLVTAETAPRIGKLLKARHVTSGSLADLERDRLQIASALVDAEMAGISTQEAQGELKEFYHLEKQIACQMVEDLGKDCEKVPAAFHKIHTKSLAAFLFFAAGLDYLDRADYDRAHDAFQKAVAEDPAFELAQQALLETPVPEMQFMMESGTGIGTTEEMIAMAASNGVPAEAAGTAVGVRGDQLEVASGGVGIVPLAGVVGGAAVVAGVVVAGSSSDSESAPIDSSNTPPKDVTEAVESDFAGTFNVTDQSRTFDEWHAQLTFNSDGSGSYLETVSGNQNSGTLTWNFNSSTNTLSFTSDGGARFSGTATGVLTNFTLTGTWVGGSSGTIHFVRQS